MVDTLIVSCFTSRMSTSQIMAIISLLSASLAPLLSLFVSLRRSHDVPTMLNSCLPTQIVNLENVEGLRARFNDWLEQQGKKEKGAGLTDASYDYEARFEVFRANAAAVNAHNLAYHSGLTTYAMGLDGPFADITSEEFASQRLMTPQNCSATHKSSGPLPTPAANAMPSAVDWRTKGVVTPVKNQVCVHACDSLSRELSLAPSCYVCICLSVLVPRGPVCTWHSLLARRLRRRASCLHIVLVSCSLSALISLLRVGC